MEYAIRALRAAIEESEKLQAQWAPNTRLHDYYKGKIAAYRHAIAILQP